MAPSQRSSLCLAGLLRVTSLQQEERGEKGGEKEEREEHSGLEEEKEPLMMAESDLSLYDLVARGGFWIFPNLINRFDSIMMWKCP